MNSLKNRVTLIGNLGQDPEMKSTETGKKFTRFTLATNDGYKNADGQKVNETTWHNMVNLKIFCYIYFRKLNLITEIWYQHIQNSQIKNA